MGGTTRFLRAYRAEERFLPKKPHVYAIFLSRWLSNHRALVTRCARHPPAAYLSGRIITTPVRRGEGGEGGVSAEVEAFRVATDRVAETDVSIWRARDAGATWAERTKLWRARLAWSGALRDRRNFHDAASAPAASMAERPVGRLTRALVWGSHRLVQDLRPP